MYVDVVDTKGGLRKARRLLVTDLKQPQFRRAKALPGAYVRTSKANENQISFPPDLNRLRDLELIGDVELSPAAAWWKGHQEATLIMAGDLASMDDYPPFEGRQELLYPYQRVGVRWLRYVNRCILGDEMGLGKTVQAIGAVRGCDKILVVTVNMAKHSVWENHLLSQKWGLGMPVGVADGHTAARREAVEHIASVSRGALIINHEMLQSRHAGSFRALYQADWDAVILDEAHKFQDASSSQSKGAQRLKSKLLYLLTGTPVWNRPESLFGLLHLIDPERWSSEWNFVNEYCEIEVTPWSRKPAGLKPHKVEQLQELLVPILLRRTKDKVLPQLPAKRVQTITYELPRENRKAYQVLKKKFKLLLPDGGIAKIEPNVAAAFADLRRFCNSPALLGVEYDDPKLEALEGLLEEAHSEGKQVVIFAWHHDYMQFLDAWLTQAKIPHGLITGRTPSARREEQLTAFQAGDYPILIAGISVMGTAVDLTCASVAIFAEASYVPTHVVQAEDRLHRIGQVTDVMIYRLAAARTVEAAIWATVDARSDETDELLAFADVAFRVTDGTEA